MCAYERARTHTHAHAYTLLKYLKLHLTINFNKVCALCYNYFTCLFPYYLLVKALHCELLSIFRDRLSTTEDIEKFDAVLKQTLRKIKSNEVRADNIYTFYLKCL